jgi:hypothetical protein
MILVRSFRFSWVGIFLAATPALSPVLCKADEKVLLGLVEEVANAHPDVEDPSPLIVAKIRQHYGKDEAALLRDAMDLASGESGYATLLVLLSEVKISQASRLSLVEQIVTAKNDEAMSKVRFVLSKCDMVRAGNGVREPQPDISRHREWLKKGEALPAEYAAYLFAQNGAQAWEYLGSGDADNPQVKILSRFDGLLSESDPMARRKQWIKEILPVFVDGLNLTNPYDAAYLAWFIGRDGLGDSAAPGHMKLVDALEKALPGYAGVLMGSRDAKPITRTTAAEATRWLAMARGRIPAE